MRAIVAAALMLLSQITQAAQIVLPKWPQPAAVWANSASGAGLAWGVERVIDLTGWAPPGTIGVQLSGLLLITHGTLEQTCDLVVYFRPDASSKWGDYRLQTLETFAGGKWPNGVAAQPGGQRTNASVMVPVVNNQFRVLMYPASGTPYPNGCSFGVSLFPDFWITQ